MSKDTLSRGIIDKKMLAYDNIPTLLLKESCLFKRYGYIICQNFLLHCTDHLLIINTDEEEKWFGCHVETEKAGYLQRTCVREKLEKKRYNFHHLPYLDRDLSTLFKIGEGGRSWDAMRIRIAVHCTS